MGYLFESISVGRMQLANRLVMPPMATGKADEKNRVTDDTCCYYRERARYSRVGLIITEHCYITPRGKASPAQLSIASDDDIPGLRRLVECVHGEGVKIIAQINHAGSASKSGVIGGRPVGPSAVPHPRNKEELPEEMTEPQIREAVSLFADAALRAERAGLDGVEIHSAHGYLLDQFFSPLTNRRTDEYGASSIDDRTRIHREVIGAVRGAVGEGFVIALRLGGCDYEAGGSTIEDCAAACRIFEECGVDLIDLSGGMNGYIRPGRTEPGYFKDMSIAAKQAVKIPVMLTGGVTELGQAEALIDEGCADMIGVGRAIYENARWAE